MRAEIQYSGITVRDLDRVWSDVFRASGNSNIASEYVAELMDKIEAKADFPKSGKPLYYENAFTGYYYVAYKAYLAFYRLKDEKMLVDRVLLGKSDYIRRLHL